MSDQKNNVERLHLRLPPGLKKAWKKKSKDRNFGAIWKYLKFLVENDIKENEIPPKTVEIIEKLYAENHLLFEKMQILTDKINTLTEIMTTKTLIKRILSETEKRKILDYAATGKKLSEIANHVEREEISTLAILDTLEGMGKIRLESESGLWFANE